ncbi:hypothetical protein CGU00_02690 [Vibrio metoecus]|nr:hypothetical protein CGU00_02690 [Vibrio metoecus]PAR61404.1 hypothetical protein CGT90_10300 [Vibrio metoecus]
MIYNKSLQLTKISVMNFGSQNIAPDIFATELSVSFLKAKIIKIQTSCSEKSAFSVQIAQFGI